MTDVRLMLGDCLERLSEVEAGSVDAVVTDPPYCSGGRQNASARSVVTKSSRDDAAWFLNDNMGSDTYLWWMRHVAKQCLRVASAGAHAHVFTDWRQYNTTVTAWESSGWTLRGVLVWDKAKGGAMGSFWRNNHEWDAIFTKGSPRPLAHGGYFNTWTGTKPHGGEHPTEKPLGLMRYIVSSIAPLGAVILDPFMGSGTTGQACVAEGHGFIGIEQNGVYFSAAEKRIREATLQQRMTFEEAA